LLLAIATSEEGEPKYFRTLSALDAADCARRAELLVCANARPARAVADYSFLPPTEQCLIALFLSHQPSVIQNCPFAFVQPFDEILPVDDSAAITVSASPDTASIACADGSFMRVSLAAGLARVDVRSDCSLHTRAGIFHAVDHPRETRAILVHGSNWLLHIDTAINEAPELVSSPPPASAPMRISDFRRLHEIIKNNQSLSFLTILLYSVGGGLAAGLGACALFALCNSAAAAPWHRIAVGRRPTRQRATTPIRKSHRSTPSPLPSPPRAADLLADPLLAAVDPVLLRRLLQQVAAASRVPSDDVSADATLLRHASPPHYANAI
jgi:hypothetical protein